MRIVFDFIMNIFKKIFSVDCHNEQVTPYLRHIINTENVCINEDDYITADDAYSKKYLNCSRYAFFYKIKPKYNLKAYFTHKNKPIGFKRSEIIEIMIKEKRTK